jgi:hypothetical protein
MEHGAFEEEHIDVADGALHEVLEELSFAAVRAKIAAVEQALAFGLDEEGVGIGGGVVDEIGRDGKRANGRGIIYLTPLGAKRRL